MSSIGNNENIAFSSPAIIKELQEIKLHEHITYCKSFSPYYRRRMSAWNIDLKKPLLAQLGFFPFTEKKHIEQYNNEFCAVSFEKVADISLSSGTTGKPLRVLYTENDLNRIAYNEKKSFAGCGIGTADTVLLTCTMDRCFIAGLAYFLGLRKLGVTVIRNGINSLESHAEIIKRMNPTVIIGVPSFLRKLGLRIAEYKVDPQKTNISKLICIGEPIRDKNLVMLQVGKDLEKMWDAKIFSTYASSEIITTFCECAAQQGGHLHPDLAIIEIIDEKGIVLGPNSIGEIVVTPLSVEGMPLIRYKTGDISFLVDAPCTCGRFSQRLGPILGRKNQLMKFQGTSLYPQAIFTAIEELSVIDEYYITVTSENDLSDHVVIHASINDRSYTKEMIEQKLQAHLRVKPEVIFNDNAAIKQKVYATESRKPIRFIDKRISV